VNKPNPLDYSMTAYGDLQYQFDLERWQEQERERFLEQNKPSEPIGNALEEVMDINQVILELKCLGEVAEVNGMTVEGNALHPIINASWQALEHLRAEVARLKSDLESYMRIANDEANENVSLTQQLAAANGRVEMLRETLTGLRDYALKSVCYHDETHRAGAIWEICDLCGKKWADDEGGKPEFKEPKEISKANAALSNLNEDRENRG
jgi:hypothetical protein